MLEETLIYIGLFGGGAREGSISLMGLVRNKDN